ncbi:hypothetical protein ERO13_A11G128300v2 [Gossypium hirsutum]|uniref:Uncharacterized protein n=5 Tax=Gossypium TaxID=3633 RepID=A0A5D2X5S8_GOSMU|nr:hypothetical protein ES319_A11G137800v1 [Gossypium barbadense]KAG4174554.1 hypothetical protein ERO13_A11G128300v2 [Gossypium hirsutum]KAK5783985.1 hypothetical protein PVK06_038503 [Gossypium arboreum]TYI00615.1 hypothetical protein ES332_A11G146100v1 [Gossypium tomentosum]TYJ09426.1 hypothetical protein E1A91_A11G140900v1 [Gossypium mustelinum]
MTDCIDPGKSSWPELVGTNGEVAAHIIAKENPKVSVQIVKEGMMDNYGIVKTTPHIG